MTSSRPMENVVLYAQEPEQEAARLGPGISRPHPTDLTEPYVVTVKFPNALPMKVTLHARSGLEAERFASNRWPSGTCVAEVKT